jgi:hypothetical protein
MCVWTRQESVTEDALPFKELEAAAFNFGFNDKSFDFATFDAAFDATPASSSASVAAVAAQKMQQGPSSFFLSYAPPFSIASSH